MYNAVSFGTLCTVHMSGPPEEGAVGGLKSLKKLAHRWSVGMSQFEEGVRDATSKEPYVGSTSNECLSCIRKSGFRRLQTRRPGQSAPRYNETVEQIVVSLDPREPVSMGPCPPIISISRNDADTVIFVMEERCKDPELIVPGADAPKYWKTLKVQIVFPFVSGREVSPQKDAANTMVHICTAHHAVSTRPVAFSLCGYWNSSNRCCSRVLVTMAHVT